MDKQEIQQKIDKLQDKLDELKSPKHGDIVDHYLDKSIIIKQNGVLTAYNSCGCEVSYNEEDVKRRYRDGIYTRVSNVFDS